MPRFIVAVSELRAQVDPLSGEMWKCEPISIAEVKAAVQQHPSFDLAWQEVEPDLPMELHRTFHIGRIARLATQPITDQHHQIMIAIGPDKVWAFDGNHRIAAAIVRGDVSLELTLVPFEDAAVLRTFPSAKAI